MNNSITDLTLFMNQLNTFLETQNVNKRYTNENLVELDFMLSEINLKRTCLLCNIPNINIYISKIRKQIVFNVE